MQRFPLPLGQKEKQESLHKYVRMDRKAVVENVSGTVGNSIAGGG